MDDLSAVLHTPVEDVAIEQLEPVEGGEQDQQQAEEKVDGRRFNPKWSSYLKEIKDQATASGDTVRAQEISDMVTKMRDNYARYQTVQEMAPKGLDDVRAWKTTIDAVGGPEAAAEMMSRVASYDAIDAKIAGGDLSVLSELPEEMQKGFQQGMPAYLSGIKECSPDVFDSWVKPHFQEALAATGLGQFLEALKADIGDNPQALAKIQQAQQWYQGQTSGAGQQPRGADPFAAQRQQFESQKQQFEAQQTEQFVKAVTEPALKYREDVFGKNLEVYKKQLGLNDSQVEDLKDSFMAKMDAKLGGDQAFQKQLAAFKAQKNRTPEAVTNYIKSKIDEHAKTTLDGIVTARYSGGKKNGPVAVAAQPTTGGAVRVAQAPDQASWDMAKMEALGYENTVKKGIYHLAGGKTVQVARQ